jgi:DNA-binding SARP family transcriptional activator
LFWEDQCQSNARSNLRKALSKLRHLLEDATAHSPLFLTTRNTIQFNPAGDHTLDITILTQLLNRHLHHFHSANELCPECVYGLEQAIALYRGPLLEQIQLSDSEAFETWMTLNRQHLHDLIISAYVKLVAHYEHHCHYQKAQQHVQRQLQLEPWNEVAHRSLMRILAQRGQRTVALQQYDRCCKVLEQELATQPEPATIALWQAIRIGTFPDATRVDAAS